MRSLRLVLLVCLAGGVLALPSASRAAPTWLCRPGLAHDPCTPGLATTVLSPVGATLAVHRPRARRRVDCFVVYPTVSDQPTPIVTRAIDPELRSIALFQAARYSQVCRVYAPVDRQRTIAGIQPSVSDRGPRRSVVNTEAAAYARR